MEDNTDFEFEGQGQSGHGGGVSVGGVSAVSLPPPSPFAPSVACGDAGSGPEGAAAVSHLPPLTNRGGDRTMPDYVKLTIWDTVNSIQRLLEWGVIDKFLADKFDGWTCLGAGRHSKAVYSCCEGLVFVLDYGDCVGLELKGGACDLLGSEGLKFLLDDLRSYPRVRAVRIDLKIDDVPFSVSQARLAAWSGWSPVVSSRDNSVRQFFSPTRTCPWECEHRANGQGETLYVGKRGSSQCYLRVYDRRGPVRLEIETRDALAGLVLGQLQAFSVDVWPSLVRRLIENQVEFRSGGKRSSVLPWWADTVSGAYPSPLAAPVVPESTITPHGRLDMQVRRMSRQLLRLSRAFGWNYIQSRVEYHAAGRWDASDDAAVAALRSLDDGTGMCGLPDVYAKMRSDLRRGYHVAFSPRELELQAAADAEMAAKIAAMRSAKAAAPF